MGHPSGLGTWLIASHVAFVLPVGAGGAQYWWCSLPGGLCVAAGPSYNFFVCGQNKYPLQYVDNKKSRQSIGTCLLVI